MSTPQDLLSPDKRRALRSRAHALQPVVRIGAAGLSEGVLAEIERALAAHELIKVHAGSLARDARQAALTAICACCAAQPVLHIGKVLVVYRKIPETPRLAGPAPIGAPASRAKGSARGPRGKRPASRRRS